MTPVVAAIARLLQCAPLTALVGSRITNWHAPQAPTLPCVVVAKIWVGGGQHLRGPDGIARAHLQVESRATSRPVADAVAAAVHGDGLGADATGLFGFSGNVSGFEIVNVSDAGNGRDGYDAAELRQYWSSRDYMVLFRGVA